MQDFLKSKKIRVSLWIIGAIVALLVVFGLGIEVGSRRALFASRFGENYYQNFFGSQGFPAGRMGMGNFNTHGVTGEVIDVSSSSIVVKDFRGSEVSVDILPETIVSQNDKAISPTAIIVGDGIIVIGHSNVEGRIEARFVRVFASPSSIPMLPLNHVRQEALPSGNAY